MIKPMNQSMNKSMTHPMAHPIAHPMTHQSGMTMISMVIVVVFLLFQAVIAMNVIPVYLTDSSVKKIMEELPNNAAIRKASRQEMKNLILKRIRINSIYSIKPEHIKVKKGGDVRIVTIEYEPRGKLIGNLEYVVSFKHEAKIPKK